MASNREIVLTFDGPAVTVETHGYSGPACEKATAEIEKALGARVSNVRTADYAKTATTATRQEVRR